jgi:putative sterol carrier protein
MEQQDQLDDIPEPPRQRFESSQSIKTHQELFGNFLNNRAARADQKLRANLVGSLQFNLTLNDGSKASYFIDWSKESFLCHAINNQEPSQSQAECTIEISESNLIKVAHGDLNPQIAMLSNKVKASGKLALAVYFFNLIVDGEN